MRPVGVVEVLQQFQKLFKLNFAKLKPIVNTLTKKTLKFKINCFKNKADIVLIEENQARRLLLLHTLVYKISIIMDI